MKIARLSVKFLVVLTVLFSLNSAFAQEHAVAASNDEGPVNTNQEINDYIQHHIKDSHDFHLYSYTDAAGERHHVGFPLPVILWASNGPVAFMSSAFHHDVNGEVVVEAGGSRFVNLHDKIYELENGADELVMGADGHHPENASKPLDFSISKSVFGILIIGLLMLFWFSSLARQYKKKNIPTGFGRVLEPLVIYVRDEIAKPNIGDKYRKFTGYLLTVFFFIWISNLLGLTPFGFNITGQIAVTAALAIFTLIIYTFSGTKDYWMHMLWMPGVPVLIRPVLAIIELAGAFLIKPFSLLVRLFANISAGHIVVMSLIAIMITLKGELTPFGSTTLSFILSLFITLIEVLVAFLQAYIFTMLSALFIGMAVADHVHDEHLHDAQGHDIEDTEASRREFI
ncbi:MULTISPECIES: F0F1 ATP synthase subunit A [unclassified Leeuwenhoekiella]|uniref:F0F1 ATP synthase subunit A n=1 Tax=unclassified Leeuwenhoekiella TaxID=2615029 RepID=UPI000C36245D|nr:MULTISPECIES: F0F1 ATP synthase subunit A [unclassified Leeuwenhoekiella]MAW96032.1 ATP synthase F0 subunit A [Leeuwenhoekiella sp.]MBA80026.1 ATP synthase F0 subunit A [Leeuwenhoekiella sp.]|tara:strand:- start:449 stop:1642 length:1194 start_codon:yes stop_codon:yes gene_type:complete